MSREYYKRGLALLVVIIALAVLLIAIAELSAIAETSLSGNVTSLISLIVQIVIAAGALGAMGAAIRSFRLSRDSKRAIIAPATIPGSFTLTEDQQWKLEIRLINYGMNPMSKGTLELTVYDKRFRQLSPRPKESVISNTLGPKAEWITRRIMDEATKKHVRHIKVDLNYTDGVLGETYSDEYFWTYQEEFSPDLADTRPEDIRTIKETDKIQTKKSRA